MKKYPLNTLNKACQQDIIQWIIFSRVIGVASHAYLKVFLPGNLYFHQEIL